MGVGVGIGVGVGVGGMGVGVGGGGVGVSTGVEVGGIPAETKYEEGAAFVIKTFPDAERQMSTKNSIRIFQSFNLFFILFLFICRTFSV
jgi:hypothetical protein